MRFRELSLDTRHFAEQKQFYSRILGLPLLTETADSFTIQAGTTNVHFREALQEVPYHIAFTIPRNTFTQAKGWLSQRVSLVREDGEDEIFFSNLNARSFYFKDAANNILEFIVHYDLDQETERAFGPADILHVSEIGLPVEDVPALAALLHEKLAIQPYRSPITEEFTFLGDIYGQLVVVKIGRPWLFSENISASPAPVRLTISGQREQQIQLSPFSYTLNVLAS
jgi:catechol 2,3-dioxygenase-like lactoylglutathione lyase family enzyme